jgi:hypothetical protein
MIDAVSFTEGISAVRDAPACASRHQKLERGQQVLGNIPCLFRLDREFDNWSVELT